MPIAAHWARNYFALIRSNDTKMENILADVENKRIFEDYVCFLCGIYPHTLSTQVMYFVEINLFV